MHLCNKLPFFITFTRFYSVKSSLSLLNISNFKLTKHAKVCVSRKFMNYLTFYCIIKIVQKISEVMPCCFFN